MAVGGQQPDAQEKTKSRETGGEVEGAAPADGGVDERAAEDHADGEACGLAKANAAEANVACTTGHKAVGENADGGGQAEGDGNALEGAKDDELRASGGDTGGNGENDQKQAAEQIDRAAAEEVGDGASENEAAAACQAEDGY